MQIIKPDTLDQTPIYEHKIFLAGSIEMGSAEMWQPVIEEKLKNYQITSFNPRRDDWDSTWTQRMSNPQFLSQVDWEITRLDESQTVFMHFDPNTKSMITLQEHGYIAKSGKKIIISCPDGYCRKGNVEIMAFKNGHELYDNIEDAFNALIKHLSQTVGTI